MRRAARAAPGCRPTRGARSALIPATASSGMEARDPCRSVARSRNRAVLVAFRGCRRGRRPRCRGAAAGGDRALGQHPGAEPGQGGGGGQGQAQQPQGQAAEDGQRGGGVGGQRGAELEVAGEGPGADDADQGVAGQRVGDRRQGPDGQVPPARSRGDRVHEHAGADRGQVQRPGAQRPAAVQRQRDAEAGEDQGGGVRDRGLEGGDHGEVAGGFGHPVLGGEADRRGGRGQHAQPGGGVAQPQAGAVLAGTGPSEPGAGDFAGAADLRDGRPGRAGQHERNAGHHGTAAGIMANQNGGCRAHDFCHGVTIPSGGKDGWHRGGGPRNPDRIGSAGRELRSACASVSPPGYRWCARRRPGRCG